MLHTAGLDLASAIGNRTRPNQPKVVMVSCSEAKTDSVFNLYTREVTEYV